VVLFVVMVEHKSLQEERKPAIASCRACSTDTVGGVREEEEEGIL
jgi:hypothetical protein